MHKLETIFCATTWGLMNALLIALAIESASPVERGPSLALAHAEAPATVAAA